MVARVFRARDTAPEGSVLPGAPGRFAGLFLVASLSVSALSAASASVAGCNGSDGEEAAEPVASGGGGGASGSAGAAGKGGASGGAAGAVTQRVRVMLDGKPVAGAKVLQGGASPRWRTNEDGR